MDRFSIKFFVVHQQINNGLVDMFVANLVEIDLVVFGYTILLSEKAVSEKPDYTINWPGWFSA